MAPTQKLFLLNGFRYYNYFIIHLGCFNLGNKLLQCLWTKATIPWCENHVIKEWKSYNLWHLHRASPYSAALARGARWQIVHLISWPCPLIRMRRVWRTLMPCSPEKKEMKSLPWQITVRSASATSCSHFPLRELVASCRGSWQRLAGSQMFVVY